ncbi:hypothetical protein NDU88_011698 [Pleurodeles waltl]|uniref:Gag-like protein n=1 Tax=Pleurodeles waltl TaxID=8319 RepID=A0AAV7QYF5_PLEWA|nr:hypothetical protein NDU88_011698 [Pleurodeles waltl]
MARSHDLSAARATEMDVAITQTPEKAPTIKAEWVGTIQGQQLKGKSETTAPVKQGPRCTHCGHKEHALKDYPAQGRWCSNCGKRNHFATTCHAGAGIRSTRGRRQVTKTVRHKSREGPKSHGRDQAKAELKHKPEESSPEEEEIFLISFTNDLKKNRRPQPTCVVNIAGSQVKALVDTGGSSLYRALDELSDCSGVLERIERQVAFLLDVAFDVVRVSARSGEASVAAQCNLVLCNWMTDAVQRSSALRIHFQPSVLFGAELEEKLHKLFKEKKHSSSLKSLPGDRQPSKRKSPLCHPSRR